MRCKEWTMGWRRITGEPFTNGPEQISGARFGQKRTSSSCIHLSESFLPFRYYLWIVREICARTRFAVHRLKTILDAVGLWLGGVVVILRLLDVGQHLAEMLV